MKRAVLIIAATAIAFAGGYWSYVKTAANRVVAAIDIATPIDFQIDVARTEIDALMNDVRKNVKVIAREEVDVEKIAAEIADRQAALTADEETIMRLKADLACKKAYYTYASKRYSPDEVKRDLAAKFERYKGVKAHLASLQQIKAARDANLAAARDKLNAMNDQKRVMEVQIEQLESRLRTLEVAQASSKIHFDDSKLGRCRKMISNISAKLAVAEKVLNAEDAMAGEIKVEHRDCDDIVSEVDRYFAPDARFADQRE